MERILRALAKNGNFIALQCICEDYEIQAAKDIETTIKRICGRLQYDMERLVSPRTRSMSAAEWNDVLESVGRDRRNGFASIRDEFKDWLVDE